MTQEAVDNIRIMTYNIHSAVNMDGTVRLQPIVQVIRKMNPDIVALQEVDMAIPSSECRHQAKALGDRLGMEYFFFPLVQYEIRHYGLAVLSRIPFTVVKRDRLPTVLPRLKLQNRGAIWIRLNGSLGPIHIFNTHLGLFHRERQRQIDALLGTQWLKAVPPDEAVVLCGDFNAGPRSQVYRKLSADLSDVQKKSSPGRRPKPTFSSRRPILRIDHMFVSDHLIPSCVEVVRSPAAEMASDHLPLFAELLFDPTV